MMKDLQIKHSDQVTNYLLYKHESFIFYLEALINPTEPLKWNFKNEYDALEYNQRIKF